MTDALPPTLADGLVTAAILAALIVAGLAIIERPEVPAAQPVCDAPVQVAQHDLSWTVCASDLSKLGCALVPEPGDRAELTPGGCRVIPGGMDAEARLLWALPLPLNRVTVKELQLLDGIGPSKAAAIIAEREHRGGFGSLDELLEVKGIGPQTLDRLRSSLEVGRENDP